MEITFSLQEEEEEEEEKESLIHAFVLTPTCIGSLGTFQ
jgi:hypothetical protein